MAFTRTLLQLRKRALYLGDLQTQTGTTNQRHDVLDVNTEINESYRTYLQFLKTRQFDLNLVETAQLNLPTTRADSNEVYSEVPWPTSSAFIRRVDVLVQGEWSELSRRDWGQLRSEYRSSSGTAPRPLVWAPKSEGSVAGALFTAGKLAIAPFCPSGGRYKITHQPEWVDITSDTDLFLFPDPAGYARVVWDVVVKFASRDRDAKGQYGIALTERTANETQIGQFVPQIIDTGPLTMTRSPDYRR